MKKLLIVIWLLFIFCKNPSGVDYVTFFVTTQEDIYDILITSGSDTLLNMGELPLSVTEAKASIINAYFRVTPVNTDDWSNEHTQCDCVTYLDTITWMWNLNCSEAYTVNGEDWEIAK